ncbi:LOW QUALITY PROTEIN: usherin [Pholidichthys leucotaenia]
MILLEKSLGERLVFSLTVSGQAVTLHYGQSTSQIPLSISFRTERRLGPERWTHLVLQIHDRKASLFLNGTEHDGTPYSTQHLTTRLTDISEDSAMWVGLSSKGSNQFIGRMQDFRFYPATLTNREVMELYSGILPELHVQSECRCPPSHPRVHPLIERYCIPNAVEDTTNDRVLRLNAIGHPLSYINDQDMGTVWLSKILTIQELDEGVTIMVDLANGQYQVFYIIVQFAGLLPESVLIQRRKLDLTEPGRGIGREQPWLDWQYMARNCNVFEMQNNGPLIRPDSVNCLQLPSDVPFSGGNITFSLLTTQPNLRPGYNDFYNTPALQQMVQASQVRIHMRGQYYTKAVGVNQRHRYIGIKEINITGRCECHGHADQCDTSVTPYRCLCLPESHTVGNNCQRCAPLYNDKPFRSGDQLQPMNCRPCECHGHAISCNYNILADDHPNEHYRGGGGVCDNCMHNTTGKNCELCISRFFRREDSDPTSVDVCQPCNCHTAGTVNSNLDCVQRGGQCPCKAAATGRRCSECLPGWYGLKASNPNGCIPCNCSATGIIRTQKPEVPNCNHLTGQCPCKPHITGRSCDRCEFGYWNLSHPDGCIPCDCDGLGSLSPFCEPEGGQCECKPGLGGRRCDSCGSGLYGLRLEGSCAPCNCSQEGTVPGTECDPYTGQCVCKENVEGHHCDTCRHGYHTLEHRNSLGCLPCACNIKGTVSGGICDMWTGQCPCKVGVVGVQCTNCAPNYYNRSSDPEKGLLQGCVPCICDPRGTVMGSVCDRNTGQCVCVPTRHGKDCSSCQPGFYLSPNQSTCLECDCHPMGALQRDCESHTGQCECDHSSVGGRRCDQCRDTFFGFNPGLGRCHPCACDPVGSVSASCDPNTGVCECKLLVTGEKCDLCQTGASHFDPKNPFGCSKAPSQQPPPVGFALSYSSIYISWHPPDSPNSHRLNYTLIRDGESVYTIQRHYPFSSVSVEDDDLSPFTSYSYWLITANVAGSTTSASASYQTLSAPPEADQLQLNLVGRPGPTSASFNWSMPRNDSGPVERFVLSSTSSSRRKPLIHYTGLSTEAVASGLKPFTQYTVILEACSSGGCTSSPPLSLLTASGPPENQPPPRVTARGPHALHVSWEPPSQLNGVITMYELFLRGPLDSQNLSSLAFEKRVFFSSGWLDLSEEKSLTNKSTMPPPESSTIVAGLQAFSTYQMRVVSTNIAGSASSTWSTAHTMEGVPEYTAPPELSALSSTSIKVTWSLAEDHGAIARGQVTEYRVNLLTRQTNNPYAPPVVSQVLHRMGPSSQPVYIAKGLKPYHVYNFTITLCTKTGCVTSLPSTGQTLPAAPSGLSAPRLHAVNESTIEIDWDPPTDLNGPFPLYQVERADVSLLDPRGPVVRGTRFTGNGYYQFPSDTLPTNTDFTGIELSFRTRSPDGLLLCAFSPGNHEEFLAIQIKNGRPYFLFDPQGSAVAVSVQGDGGRHYNDGQWHSIRATRQGAVGTIVVNDQYRGSAPASSGRTIIGENMGVFIGGLPKDFTLLREESGDAQLVQQGFTGCLRDLSFKMIDTPSEKWQVLDWTKATKKVAVYESWEGCPLYTLDGAHFLGHGYLEVYTGIFSGGQDFDISLDFRTDQLNALLLFTYSTQTEDYMLVELEAGLLLFILVSEGDTIELSMWVGLSYCDGDWKQLSLAKRGSLISAAVNDWAEETRGMGGAMKLRVDSPLYLGGVPTELIHPALDIHSHRHSLGGCIRGLTVTTDERNPAIRQRVNLSVASHHSVRVYLDGCPTSESRYNCRGNDSVLVYSGRNTQATDYSLQPFTEYLYRLVALGAGGWAAGPWQRGRSRGKVPSSMPPPTAVQSLSGYRAKVSWVSPTGDIRGLIDRYELNAYHKDYPGAPPVKATYLANGNFTGVLSGLTPSTQYIVTVSACTPVGCTESLYNEKDDDNDMRWSLTTPEEAPDVVSPPAAVSSPTALYLTWEPPAKPNGAITEYLLYHDNQLVHRGEERQHNITGLGVYSTHVFLLSACTSAGCTNSSQITLLTSQLPPGPLQAPSLTLLDSRTIFVEWSRPSQINGVLEFYSVFLSHQGAEPVLAYNSSELFEDHTLRNLTPGTTYTVTVAACTGGGCTLSPPSHVETEESTPENVAAPLVTPLSPYALNVSWTPPDSPNGVITSYGLWLDGVLVLNSSSSQRFFVVEGLSPWSRHVLRLQACTAQGCGMGPMVDMRTLEMPPEGPVLLELTNQSSRSLRAHWTAPPRANGNIYYKLYYKSKDGERVLDGGTTAGVWLSVTDLQPYTNYSFWIRGCNTQGCVDSLLRNVTTPPAAPDGLSPATLVHATNTSLNVSWSAPAYSNAPCPLYYGLQMRTSPQRPVIRLLENASETFSHLVEGLSPYTQYFFRVVVSHAHGKTTSSWAKLRTAEGKTTSSCFSMFGRTDYGSVGMKEDECWAAGLLEDIVLDVFLTHTPEEELQVWDSAAQVIEAFPTCGATQNWQISSPPFTTLTTGSADWGKLLRHQNLCRGGGDPGGESLMLRAIIQLRFRLSPPKSVPQPAGLGMLPVCLQMAPARRSWRSASKFWRRKRNINCGSIQSSSRSWREGHRGKRGRSRSAIIPGLREIPCLIPGGEAQSQKPLQLSPHCLLLSPLPPLSPPAFLKCQLVLDRSCLATEGPVVLVDSMLAPQPCTGQERGGPGSLEPEPTEECPPVPAAWDSAPKSCLALGGEGQVQLSPAPKLSSLGSTAADDSDLVSVSPLSLLLSLPSSGCPLIDHLLGQMFSQVSHFLSPGFLTGPPPLLEIIMGATPPSVVNAGATPQLKATAGATLQPEAAPEASLGTAPQPKASVCAVSPSEAAADAIPLSEVAVGAMPSSGVIVDSPSSLEVPAEQPLPSSGLLTVSHHNRRTPPLASSHCWRSTFRSTSSAASMLELLRSTGGVGSSCRLQEGPGPVDTPTLSGLHPRSASINWAPPTQPNGIITNYTVYLYPSSASSLNYEAHSILSNSSLISTSSLEFNTSNYYDESFIKQDLVHNPNTTVVTRLAPLSVTVPGDKTSYTFLGLHPYQTYSLQVEACTRVGCSVSGVSQTFRTFSAPPDGVPAPHLYSDTPTSVLLSWGAPERINGPLERWVIERRVAGTKQISTVGYLPPDPPPLSFLDSSSALSPWTTYQYRLVLYNQAGNSSGPWVSVTTRPSRPAGLSPPRVKVLGPESLQVSWSPPLIPSGEIHNYEIRLPEPRVSHVASNASKLDINITDLVPHTNYSITVLACSKGGGHVGGCTESLPTQATTLPSSPEGLSPLSVVALSESFLAISWQPPSRPNGPNIRYKLLRRKIHQPLAITTVSTLTVTSPPPSEDLHRWLHVYSGTKLFYQDKGLSRFTHYQYQLVVYNDVGYTSGEVVTAVTMAGVPLHPPLLSANTVNHTAVYVNWTQPSLQDLQGEVEYFFLAVESPDPRVIITFGPEITSTVITDLWPSTTYLISLQVSNGAHNTTKTMVTVSTADGKPDGMLAPEVVPVNSSSARVLWFPPLQPNGAITGFKIYVNDHLHGSVDNSSGSYLLLDLLPFTVYNIQVEVCTVYACVCSNVTKTTTVEDLPADMPMPHAQVISPRVVRLNWSYPGKPNGIMLGYEVLRRTLRLCSDGSTGVTLSLEEESAGLDSLRYRCSYLQCPAAHGVCGTSCLHPDIQICCSGIIYTKKPQHHCCDDSYLSWNDSSHPVCCDGKLVPALPDHQCCGGYHVPVKNNEYCCPDHLQSRVSVGLGDSCCGGVPYLVTGGQLCCSGSLHDGFGVQCCGGQIVDKTLVCCGDAEMGEVYKYTPGFICCGQEYINSSTSLCCTGHDGYPTMHPSGNATVTLQCCGSKVIHREEECCNGIGYDPRRHVCADRPTYGLQIEHQCLQGTVCPMAAASTAYCGSCDLDPSMTACTWVLSAHTQPATHSTAHSSFINSTQQTLTTSTQTKRRNNTYKMADSHSHTHPENIQLAGSLCASHEETVYSGDSTIYTYTDPDLEPFTTYEYRVKGWNSFGRASSNATTVKTSEDKPWGVAPPRWKRLSERDDIIQLQWQAPARPNGMITHYIILRDGQERYRGDEYSFTDVGGIRPFQEYSYQLRVCNRAGCTDSTKVMAVTAEAAPEDVQPPVVTPLSPYSLHVSWSEPAPNNGVIQQYHLNQTGVGTIFTHTQGPFSYTVNDLQPYTNYSFVLVACTAVGCGASPSSTGRTLEDPPAGIWSKPRHLIINTSAVELYWDEPSQPNGHIFQYRLKRDGQTIFTGDRHDHNYTNAGLLPNHRYVYELEATTGGGNWCSDKYVIQTPASCPIGIPPATPCDGVRPYSISLAWFPLVTQLNHSQPVNYNILLNPGSDSAIMRRAGSDLRLTVAGLEPFTTYYIRVQACQIEGLRVVGAGVFARTLETTPEDLLPPSVKAAGPNVLEIHWSPPKNPNGLITSYHIYRRPLGTEEELLVFIWSSGPLEFFDASPTLRPFSYFQYRIRAHNSKGSVLSKWALAQTLEAKPQDMAPPTVRPSGAYSVHLRWSQPGQPNGLISHYRLVYKKHQQDPILNSTTVTALTVEDSVLEATVYGLEPYSQYSVRVEAVNGAGSVFSPWVDIRTLEASPAGLANFTVEQREQGRALLLSWDQPQALNGIITMYNLYSEENLEFSGLLRSFLFRRLEPWTIYTLILEACTSAGCTRTPPQHIATAAAPPASQPAPRPVVIGPDHVSLTWGPPSQSNGPVSEYVLLGRSVEEEVMVRSYEEDILRGKELFRDTSPQQAETSYTVSGLRPWTEYEFSVCTYNPAGHTCSPWVSVTTRQAPPRGLAPPTVAHLRGQPSEVVVSWSPPLEPNGVLQSYRIQRNNISFSFSFDPTVLSYTDEDLQPLTTYSYSVVACTSEGCITSPHTNITTLEAPPDIVETPRMDTITSNSIHISWSKPVMENGEVTEYVLKLNNEEAYRGRDLNTVLSDLQPYTSYQLVLVACTSGGCTTSDSVTTLTEEAPPTGQKAPSIKVTGPESVEISWRPPEHPNGIIIGYELRRDGEVIYVGPETHYHDFTLLPSVEYSYVVRANNSRGAVSSMEVTAKTHPSAPSGVGPPTLTPLGPSQVRVEWQIPVRPNGDIVSYAIYQRDPVQLNVVSTVFTPEDGAFSDRHTTLDGLAPYHWYEVRVEACTALGCSSSDWLSILTPEAPPAGQTAPLLDLQADAHTNLQTSFLLTWSPPAQPNGRILHYEVHRRLNHTTDTTRSDAATVVYRNVSTSWKDDGLQPYTVYQYQVWAVNSAGRSASPWVSGRTGPAPPGGVASPTFLHVSATSAVVDIQPPDQPNGIVSLYKVFSVHNSNYTMLSEGTSHQQTLHGLRPYTQYWVGVEACTCYRCCSQGPLSELHTLAAPPAQQLPPRPVTLTSRSVQLEWDEPLEPNGLIESCELHIRSTCPQPPQPVPVPCVAGTTEICFFGKKWSYNVTGLQPYSTYELRAACFNNMGSTASNWTTVSTLSEAPQYVSPFSVDSNLTVIWLDWTGSFSLNGYLKEYSVTESQLRVYTGFYSYLHIPRTSQKTLSFQVTCTTASGSASTPTIRYSPATGLAPIESEDSGKQGVSMSATPVYSELWFILLLTLLGLFLLAILLGLVLQRALRKNPSARERPPLVMLQKTRKGGGDTYMFDTVADCVEISNVILKSYTVYTEGLADTKIVGTSSQFSPISVLRVPSQTELSQAYSQHSLHRSVSQLIDRKSLMLEEGGWDNPLRHDSGLYVEEDEFVDAIRALRSVKKEHTMFTDTHL